jgi:hypothetical protein
MNLKSIVLGFIVAMAITPAGRIASAQQEVAPERFERADERGQQPVTPIRPNLHRSRSSRPHGRRGLRAQSRSYLARQRRARALS